MIDRVPPRLAHALLDRVLPDDDRGRAIRGDLLEEFRREDDSRRAARRYWRHALSIAMHSHSARRPQPLQEQPSMIESILYDAKHAVRSYLKAPGFTLAVVATLGLGIGASTAIFSLVNNILIEPLPLPDPGRLVWINETGHNGSFISTSWLNYLDWRARQHSFETLALSREEPLTLTDVDRARRIRARRVTGNFFQTLGVAPAFGRALTDDDDKANAAPVVLVTDGFWRTMLGTDPAVVGRILQLNEAAYTIVGVLPPRFEYLRPYDVFVSVGPMVATPYLKFRGNHNGFYALGRLRPGVTVEAADKEMRALSADLEREYANTNSGVSSRAVLLQARYVADIRPTLLALFGAVGFLLLIACVNVANLLIARGAARRHEIAVRAALGGGRFRLVRQLLVESTVVSVLGGALGIAVGALLLQALVAAAPDGTPRIASVALDRAALLFALGAAVVCGIVFGAFPALQASGADGQQALIRGRAAGSSAGSHRLRRGLIVVESALALMLLAGAGLMIRTVDELVRLDPGFRADHIVTTRINLAGQRWTPDRERVFYGEIVERVRAIPGVAGAALAFALPIDGSQWNSIFIVGDKPVPERAQLPSAAFTPVSDGFFDTIGMRLLRGRTFTSADNEQSPIVIVVNESLAKRLWPGEDAVGKRLKQGWPEDQSPWREVVGVVADVKYNGLISDTPLQVYMPLAQETMRDIGIVARTSVDPASIVPSIESVVHQLDKDTPAFLSRTMDSMLSESIARQRMSRIVFVTFAVVALVLAAVGLYGVVAQGVAERTHEIGVRMALGAQQRSVVGLVVQQGFTMALIGAVIGVAGAIALSRWIEGLLFRVTATDPTTFAVVVGLLLAVGAAACLIPAWTAARVDPIQALRTE
ncbi:MAG TPA: ADOP family duplicated permease [Vicinamibacterales bacterium]|nr:ADOP family duplicated permease [Vicinamibacterales bacterium]